MRNELKRTLSKLPQCLFALLAPLSAAQASYSGPQFQTAQDLGPGTHRTLAEIMGPGKGEPWNTTPPSNPLSIGLFSAQSWSTISEASVYGLSGRLLAPPDPAVAASPWDVLLCTQGEIEMLKKPLDGVTTPTVDGLDVSTIKFFPSPRDCRAARAVYDPWTRRFYVLMLTISTSPSGRDIPNLMEFAVSDDMAPFAKGSIPQTWGFTFYEFYPENLGILPNIDQGGTWHAPSLGVNNDAVLIGCNVTRAETTAQAHDVENAAMFVIPKRSIVPPTDTSAIPRLIIAVARDLVAESGAGCLSPQAVSDMADTPSEAYFVGNEPADPATGKFSGMLHLFRVADAAFNPKVSQEDNIQFPGADSPIPIASPGRKDFTSHGFGLTAAQLSRPVTGTTIWAIQEIGENLKADGTSVDRNAVRWYGIDLRSSPAVAIALGTIRDHVASANPLFYATPSMAVSDQGHFAVNAGTSGKAANIGWSVFPHQSGDAFAALVSPYRKISSTVYDSTDTNFPDQWGLNSACALDGWDAMSFWAANTLVSTDGRWSVSLVHLRPPAPPQQVQISSGTTNVSLVSMAPGKHVRLSLTSTDDARRKFFSPISMVAGKPRVVVSNDPSATYFYASSIFVQSSTKVSFDLYAASNAPTGLYDLTYMNPDGQSLVLHSAVRIHGTGTAPAPKSITFAGNPSEIGGQPNVDDVDGLLTLTSPAPGPMPTTVTLFTDKPSVIQYDPPGTFQILPGQTNASFRVRSSGVKTPTSAQVIASWNGAQIYATFTVLPHTLGTIHVPDTAGSYHAGQDVYVVGGTSEGFIGLPTVVNYLRVYLTGSLASDETEKYDLSVDNPIVTLSTQSVSGVGASSGVRWSLPFSIKVGVVSQPTTVNLKATIHGTSTFVSIPLHLIPFLLQGWTIDQNIDPAGGASHAKLNFLGVAPKNLPISLASSNATELQVNQSTTITAGASKASPVDFKVFSVEQRRVPIVTATYGKDSVQGATTLRPTLMASINRDLGRVKGGTSYALQISLTKTVPYDLDVIFGYNHPELLTIKDVKILANTKSVVATIQTSPVMSEIDNILITAHIYSLGQSESTRIALTPN